LEGIGLIANKLLQLEQNWARSSFAFFVLQ
jgi:hypothetical protein